MSKIPAVYHNAYGILKAMKVGRTQRGFTIIETMLVLVVSSALFVVAAVSLSGRQARSEFDQSIQDIRSQIQQAVNDVASGYYPKGNLTCSVGANGPTFSTVTAAGQGENTGCITLGKVLQFKLSNAADPERFQVFTLAGLQRTATGNEVTTYAEAKPLVVAPTTAGPGADLSQRKDLLYGLRTSRMFYNAGAGNVDIGAFALVSSLNSYNGTSLLSGSQQVNVMPVVGSSRGADPYASATTINSALRQAGAPVNPKNGVSICFASDGLNRSGLITVGGQARQLSVTLDIKNGTSC